MRWLHRRVVVRAVVTEIRVKTSGFRRPESAIKARQLQQRLQVILSTTQESLSEVLHSDACPVISVILECNSNTYLNTYLFTIR